MSLIKQLFNWGAKADDDAGAGFPGSPGSAGTPPYPTAADALRSTRREALPGIDFPAMSPGAASFGQGGGAPFAGAGAALPGPLPPIVPSPLNPQPAVPPSAAPPSAAPPSAAALALAVPGSLPPPVPQVPAAARGRSRDSSPLAGAFQPADVTNDSSAPAAAGADDSAALAAARRVTARPRSPAGSPMDAAQPATRVIGVPAPADSGEDVLARPRARVSPPIMHPAGWLLVTSGPGRGACFTLTEGVSPIGRGPDQPVRLDFGDQTISRQSHALVAFDPQTARFYLGHGGKQNLVRLNGSPVLSTRDLSTGDRITIGETTLTFVALCGPEFSWDDTDDTAPGSA